MLKLFLAYFQCHLNKLFCHQALLLSGAGQMTKSSG